jgi:hypothetical protein
VHRLFRSLTDSNRAFDSVLDRHPSQIHRCLTNPKGDFLAEILQGDFMRKSSIPSAASQDPIRLTAIRWARISLAIAVSLGRERSLHDLAQFLHLATICQPDLTIRPTSLSDLIRIAKSLHPELIPGMRGSLQTLVRRGFATESGPETYSINPSITDWRSANGKPALSRKARFAIGLLTTIG